MEFNLWMDETGFIVTIELILIATIVVIGLIAGLTVVRNAILAELSDVGRAIGNINQSYRIPSVQAIDGVQPGSGFVDQAESDNQSLLSTANGNSCIEVFGIVYD